MDDGFIYACPECQQDLDYDTEGYPCQECEYWAEEYLREDTQRREQEEMDYARWMEEYGKDL